MGHSKEFKKNEVMHPMQEEAEMILSEISDWLNYYWDDESTVNADIEKNNSVIVDNNSMWYLYDDQREFRKSEIRNLQVDENIILPTIEELSDLVSEDGVFHKLDVNESPIYYLSNDLNRGYTQFKYQFSFRIDTMASEQV